MSVALEKIDGVTAVKITLKDGHARLTLKPGNTVTLAEIRRIVKRNGFTPQAAAVVAEVEPVAGSAAQLTLRISGTSEDLALSPATSEKIRGELQKQANRRVAVDGVVPAGKDGAGDAIDVRKLVKTAGK